MQNSNLEQIYELIQKMRSDRDNRHNSHEQSWIEKHLSNKDLKVIVPRLSIIALHILSALRNKELTGVELAVQLKVTRGGITRAAKKLLDYNLIVAKRHENDKKKIYYQITGKGKEIATIHDKMTARLLDESEKFFLNKYSDTELKTVISFLKDMSNLESNFDR